MLRLQKDILRNIFKFNNKNCANFSSESTNKSIKTALYDFHIQKEGKVVDFAGFLLPIQYADLSMSASHLQTRNAASIFDVSHMLQTTVTGKNSIEWFESLCPVDLKNMKNGSSALTVFLNEKGGILDDLIVTKVDDTNLYVVSNAGRIDHDKKHMKDSSDDFKSGGKDVNLTFLNPEDVSLIALQGPKAVNSLQTMCSDDLSTLKFMTSRLTKVDGIENCRVTRCGYTGEDGVELSVPSNKVQFIVEKLLQQKDVKLAGLGARDSLRLEAGLCLYGNDIYDTVTPVEANLSWLIAKQRRIDGKFIGASVVLSQLKDGVTKRRIGLKLENCPPARKGMDIITNDEKLIGIVTSGCPSPSLGFNIAMGYVEEGFKKIGTELAVIIRNKSYPCQVAKMPFIPSKYYTK